jgi:hypothetical protein
MLGEQGGEVGPNVIIRGMEAAGVLVRAMKSASAWPAPTSGSRACTKAYTGALLADLLGQLLEMYQ